VVGPTGPQGIQGPTGPAGSGGGSGGGTSVTGPTPPATAVAGDQWWDTYTGRQFIYYGGAWVEEGPALQGKDGSWTTAQIINNQSGNYTLVAGDVGKLVIMNTGTTSANLTVPPDLGLSGGNRIDFLQYGSGQVTVVGGSGVTVSFPGSLGPKLRTQYSSATLLCITTNVYVLIGDISA
jgi:hypothetical protein